MGNVIIDFQVALYSFIFSMSLVSVLFLIRYYNKYSMYIITFIIFSILMGLCYEVHDYNIYAELYAGANYFDINYIGDIETSNWYGFSYDYGFALIGKICNILGLSYEEFRFVSETILIGILFLIIIKIVSSANLFIMILSLYIIFPFWDDIFQMRNFYVEVLFIVAFILYVYSHKYKIIKYTCIMFIATSFHSIAWAYLPFALLKKLGNNFFVKKIYRVLIIFGLMLPLYAMFIGTVLAPISVLVLSNLTGLPDSFTGHYMGYLGESMGFGWLIPYIYSVLSLLCLWGYLPKLEKRAGNNHTLSIQYLKALLTMMCFICIFLPLQPFTSNLMRIPRNTLVLNYIGLALSMPLLKQKEKFLGYCIALLCAFIMGLSDFYVETNDSSFGFYEVLENNFLFDILN